MSKAPPPGAVRVIGGLWRGTKLPVPAVNGLRPTGDRLRETLFNWLGQDLQGWRVLDAFAGSGALGFEAASRGAAAVQLVEREPQACAALATSIQRLKGAPERMQLARTEVLSWMRACPQRFDLVLLDPPFDADLFDAALAAAVPLLNPGGSLYLEAPRPFAAPAGCTERRHLKSGAVHAHLFVKAAGS
jgi:16S rRNA (guanine966-N2)-methyltransferase